MSTGEFAGKAIAVTGAASGLGRAASIRFAKEGGKLCLIDLNQQGLEETAATIRDAGGDCLIGAGDLGDPANCKAAVAAALDAFGRLDVLCNVAGILRFHALEHVTQEDWNRLFSANVSGAFFMMQAAMPHLIESKGNVVNVVSTASFLGQAYTAPYAATKSALLSLTKSLAMEYMHHPVRINALAPGGMLTEMVQTLEFPADADQSLIARYIGLRPPSQPEDIVEPLLFLASDRARSVHGACYTADSGITAG